MVNVSNYGVPNYGNYGTHGPSGAGGASGSSAAGGPSGAGAPSNAPEVKQQNTVSYAAKAPKGAGTTGIPGQDAKPASQTSGVSDVSGLKQAYETAKKAYEDYMKAHSQNTSGAPYVPPEKPDRRNYKTEAEYQDAVNEYNKEAKKANSYDPQKAQQLYNAMMRASEAYQNASRW